MTYVYCKKIIERGNYNKEEMLNKLDVFLLNNRITEDQYKELVGIINETQIVTEDENNNE